MKPLIDLRVEMDSSVFEIFSTRSPASTLDGKTRCFNLSTECEWATSDPQHIRLRPICSSGGCCTATRMNQSSRDQAVVTSRFNQET